MSGTLLLNGLGQHLVPGDVRLIGRHSYATKADVTGEWSIQVPVGTYRVVGTSPRYGTYLCDGPESLVVSDKPQSGVQVLCQD